MQQQEQGPVAPRPAYDAGAAPRQEQGTGPVLVVGNSRSGTTMLARMLGRHSAVHALKELHFAEELWLPADDRPLTSTEAEQLADRLLHNARVWYHAPYAPGTFADDSREVVAGLEPPVHGVDVLRAVLAGEARRAGKQVAVEQTPTNVFYVEQLLDRLPGAHAVVLVRDPRDVLLSQKNWWRRRFRGTAEVPWSTTFRQWADYHPVLTSVIWRGGVRAGSAAAARADVTTLRFEDLVTDPRGSLARVLAPLGLEVEEQMLDVPRISSSNSTDRAGTGVDPSVVGQFREGLGAAELWVSQRLTRSELARHGYEPVEVRTPVLGLAGVLLLLPVKVLLATALNRGRSRNLLTSVRRRLGR